MIDLSEKFKNIPEDTLQTILQKFCRITVSDRHSQQFMRGQNQKNSSKDASGSSQFKFMKSKDSIQTLTLTIIALVVHLSTQGKSKGYFLERILKKSIGDLRSYFKEVGLMEEPTTRRDRETEKDVPDVFVYFSGSYAHKRAKKAEEEQAAGDVAAYGEEEEY